MSFEGEKPPALRRRDMLMLGGGAALSLGLKQVVDRISRNEPRREKSVYRDGDTISIDGAKITIDKWNLRLDLRGMDFNARPFSFQLMDSALPSVPEVGNTFLFPQDFIESKNDVRTIGGFPTDPSEPVNLLYIRYKPGQGSKKNDVPGSIEKQELFPIEFSYYTGPLEEGVPTDFYEIDIGTRAAQDLYEQRQAFKPFAGLYMLYVHDSPQATTGETDQDKRQIHLTSGFFVRPQFKDQGLLAGFHERCHIVRKSIQDNNLQQPAYVKLENAYERIARAVVTPGVRSFMNDTSLNMKYDPTNFPEPIDATLFRMVTESHYARKKKIQYGPSLGSERPIRIGHPQDDANELFASTASVLRFFPTEFIEEYRALTGEEKLAIREAVHATFDAFRSVSRDEKDLIGLFPEYRRIAKVVKFGENF